MSQSKQLLIYHPFKLCGIAMQKLLSECLYDSVFVIHSINDLYTVSSDMLILVHPDQRSDLYDWKEVCRSVINYTKRIIVVSYFPRRIKIPNNALFLNDNPTFETLTSFLEQNEFLVKRQVIP